MYPNGETIRILVNKLPDYVFDTLVEEYPDLMEISPDKTEYIHWEPFSDEYYEDDIARDYDFKDYEEMLLDGPVTILFPDEGLLIIE